jgi:hypothetical protein
MWSEPVMRAPFQRLRCSELGPKRHQPGHFRFRNLDFLAAERGKIDVADDVIVETGLRLSGQERSPEKAKTA